MPVGFNSPARNFFLLGSSGDGVVGNFFDTIDRSAGTDGVYLPDEIRYNYTDQKYLLAGSASDSASKSFGWFEKRDEAGALEFDVRVEAGVGVNTTLRAMELDSNNNLIVAGFSGTAPWIAKYSNSGVLDWQSTTFSANVRYLGLTSDSNGNYYACGRTSYALPDTQAFVEKFDTNGNPSWGKSAFMLGRDVVLKSIAANSRGEVVAVGFLEDDSADKGYIVKIDTNTGEVLWDRTLSPDAGGDQIKCTDVYIDNQDQIYVSVNGTDDGYLVKYTPEGNIQWQRKTAQSSGSITYDQVFSDGETQQTVVFGTYTDSGDTSGLLTKYSRNGDLVWRRTLTSSFNNSDTFASVCLDGDPSFYYFMYIDGIIDGLNGTPDSYTFGKVSSSGNGLGAFQYTEGTGETIDYVILNEPDKIGRLSDGSVRHDTSDLIAYPFGATKIMFDDLAAKVTNKKRQMDDADSFEYSGSPAIRIADFQQELNLLGDVYSGSGDWLDQSGKGNNAITTVTTTAEEPFSGAGSVEFDGNGDYLSFATSSNFALGTGDWTVEYFAYPESTAQYQRHFYLIGSSSNQIEGIFADSNGISFGRTSVWAPAQVAHTINQWNHYALVHDSTNMRLYINGIQVLTSGDNFVDENKSLVIGHSNSTFGGFFDGYMSNFRIINGTALYTSNFTPPTAALTNTGQTTGTDYYTGSEWSPAGINGPEEAFVAGNSGSGGNGGNFGPFTYTFANPVTGVTSARIRGALGASVSQVSSTTNVILVDGQDVTQKFKNAGLYTTVGWVDVTAEVGGTWNSFRLQGISGSTNPNISGVEVNGVQLLSSPGITGTVLLTAQGSSITDASDSNLSITVNGDTAASVGGTNTVAHNAGGWFEFDGVNDYIQLATNSDLTFAGDFSYETWLWTDVQPASNHVWSLPDGQTFQFTTLNSQSELIYYSVPTNNQSFGPLANNTWAHYVITKFGNTLTGYLNGVQAWTSTPGSSLTHNFSGASIGYRTLSPGNQFYWDGRMGEIRIYKRALTAAAVFQNYNATKETFTGVAASTNPGLTSTRTP